MTNDQLQKTLTELRAELANLKAGDEAAKTHIQQLIESLEQHLSEPANDTNRAVLRDNLSSAIERLEAEHPRLTLFLNQIMNTLSGSGI